VQILVPTLIFSSPSSKHNIIASNIELHELRCERSGHVEITDETNSPSKNQPNSTKVPTKQFKKDDLRPSNSKIITCPTCKENVPENEFQTHQDKYCKDSSIPCEFCGKSFPIIAYEAHADLCNMNPSNLGISNDNIKIPCEICGKNIPGNLYEGHAAECQSLWERNKTKKPEANVNYSDYNVVDDEEDDNLFSHSTNSRNSTNS
jgi:hypothetical protein